MGCSQSKTTTDQIVERVSVDTPAVEVLAPVNSDVSALEVAIETPPSSTEELSTVRASVLVDDVEETRTTKEHAAVLVGEEVEKPAESAVDHVEEVVAKPAESAVDHVNEVVEKEAAALVKETHVPQTVAPVEEVAETPEEEAFKLEEKVVEEEVEALSLHSESRVEDSEGAVEDLFEDKDNPTSEVVTVDPVSENEPIESSIIFKAENVTFNEKGVAFYNFDGSDINNPIKDVHISKRYSDFKALHAQLTGKDSKVTDLPALPTASFLQGRNDKKMLEDRKTQFTALLNAIAMHPLALQSDVFRAFLA